jgi:polysaccharide export outer membrane protein
MKRYLALYMLIIFLSACVSPKELTYFQEISISNTEVKRSNKTPYKLQIDNILNIKITSKNADIVADEISTHLKKKFN